MSCVSLGECLTPRCMSSGTSRRHVRFWSEFGGGGMAVIVKEVKEVIKTATGLKKEASVCVTDNNLCDVEVPAGVLSSDVIHALKSGGSPYIRVRGEPTVWEVKYVEPLGTCSVVVDVSFLLLHFCLDVLQIHNFYMSGNHLFAGLTLFSRTAMSVAQRMGSDTYRLIHEESEHIRKRGYHSDAFLKLLDLEQGFQGYVSLAVSSYGLWFEARDWWTCAIGLLSVFTSLCGVASYLFRNVFLNLSTYRWSKERVA